MSEWRDLHPGADLESDRPCLTTWCLYQLGHTGPCVEIPRAKHPPPDFGPNRAVKAKAKP